MQLLHSVVLVSANIQAGYRYRHAEAFLAYQIVLALLSVDFAPFRSYLGHQSQH